MERRDRPETHFDDMGLGDLDIGRICARAARERHQEPKASHRKYGSANLVVRLLFVKYLF